LKYEIQKKRHKKEHHIIEDGEKALEELIKLGLVKSIIPGRIKTSPKGRPGKLRLTYQYDTKAGAKLLLKKGSTVQEVFVITDKRNELREFMKNNYNT